MKKFVISVIGCGDFLRCQMPALLNSSRISVKSLYDPVREHAQKYASSLGARVETELENVLSDRTVDIVALFVPPWVRKDLFKRVVASGKHVITTKPLGATVADCDTICQAAKDSGIKAAVIYGRTENSFIEAAKELLLGGEVGRLALYRQDWIHAYPQWNNWATDPTRNGGPFLDAMIHNLNAACYLMSGPPVATTFFSDRLAHPDMACADTESLVVKFKTGGLANLFITWAADLATYSREENNREHIDWFFLVSSDGWMIKRGERAGASVLVATRDGKEKIVSCADLRETHYDAFVRHLEGGEFPRVLATLEEASRDIQLIREGITAAK